MKWTCVFGVCLTLAGLSSSARASQCLGPEASAALTSCPAEAKKVRAGARAPVSMKSLPAPKKAAEKPPPPPPVPPDDRDARNAKKKLRSLSLLIQETHGLERLLKRTSKKSPDHLQLQKRLADDYAEIEAVARAAGDQAERDIARHKAKNAKATAKARAEAARAKKTVLSARANAIRQYRAIKADHPSYAKLDEVLYYLAYEHEQAGDAASARKVYLELIEKAPKSGYVPRAYLAFGELFFHEAIGDPSKWPLAEQAYREAAKYPPPGNAVYGIARHKLAYVYWNQADLPRALSELKAVIEWGTRYASLPNARALGRSARRDSVAVYAASGAAERAFSFFEPLAGAETLALLEDLGVAYLDIGRYAEAVTLYRELARRNPGPRECHYQGQVTLATQAQKSSDKDAIGRELSRLLGERDKLDKSDAPAATKLACANQTAELMSETAMAWHLEAVGSGGVRGTNDPRTLDRAAELYAKILASFAKQDFARFTFPRFVRQDWPTLGKIAYARADLYYARGRWDDCAKAFDEVFQDNPKGADASEAAYASLLCHQKLRDQARKGRSDREGRGLGPGSSQGPAWQTLAPKPLGALDRRMLAAFDRYLCWVDPGQAGVDQHVEVELARARTYYEAQHWEEAAIAFRHVALEHASHEAGIYAAQLYLEALNVLATRAEPPRASCIDDMARDVPKLSALYCKSSRKDVDAEQCEVLARVAIGVERTRLEQLVRRADALPSGSSAAIALYTQAGDGYLALWRGHCEGPLAKGEKPKQCDGAAEILTNLARAYQAARLLAKAMQARAVLLDPRYGLANTEHALRAIFDTGANYQAIAVYDRAADHYELYVDRICQKSRCGPDADQALFDAAVLRLGLGAPERALANAERYERWFGGKNPARTAQLRFAVAASFGERGKWDEARKRLSAAMGLIDKQAGLDVRVLAHALLGRALVEQRQAVAAAREYQRVLALWSDSKRAAQEIRATEPDSQVAERKLGRALEAVGEAQFFFAEQKKARVDALRFPVYKGPGTKEAVREHVATKVKAWVQAKRPLIEDASVEYRKVANLSPAAPPRWVIASGARVGHMWGTFVKEFRAAPIPDAIRRDPELRAAYYAELDRMSEPQKLVARSAYDTCLSYSVEYQYWDDKSRECEEWLADNYKADYHLIDEFRGAPTRKNGPESERPRPIVLPLALGRRR